MFLDFFRTESYRDVGLNAVNLGGDTDTIAALAGGIAGIYYGFRLPDFQEAAVLRLNTTDIPGGSSDI